MIYVRTDSRLQRCPRIVKTCAQLIVLVYLCKFAVDFGFDALTVFFRLGWLG